MMSAAGKLGLDGFDPDEINIPVSCLRLIKWKQGELQVATSELTSSRHIEKH